MKNKRTNYDFRTGFIDFLLCCFVVFIVLSFIQTLLINPIKKIEQEGIRKNAEYTIELQWSSELDCDFDLWVADPEKTTVSFRTKSNGLMHLERDDLGFINDTYSSNNTIYKFNHNTELVTIRGLVPGKYTINVHLYACRFNGVSLPVNAALPEPIGVGVILTKLNPNLFVMTEKKLVFQKVWEEKTAVTVDFDIKGYVNKYEMDYVKLITVEKQEPR